MGTSSSRSPARCRACRRTPPFRAQRSIMSITTTANAGLSRTQPIPDESTILHFRHPLERHHLGVELIAVINRAPRPAGTADPGGDDRRREHHCGAVVGEEPSTRARPGDAPGEEGERVALRDEAPHRGGCRDRTGTQPERDEGERLRCGGGAPLVARERVGGVARRGLPGGGEAPRARRVRETWRRPCAARETDRHVRARSHARLRGHRRGAGETGRLASPASGSRRRPELEGHDTDAVAHRLQAPQSHPRSRCVRAYLPVSRSRHADTGAGSSASPSCADRWATRRDRDRQLPIGERQTGTCGDRPRRVLEA